MTDTHRWAAFLRAINVGGRTIKMEPLREVFRGLGYGDVATHIASGNVMFSASGERAELEAAAEKALQAALGYGVATFLRTGEELAAVLAAEPLGEAAQRGATTYIGFTRGSLTPSERQAVEALATPQDTVRVVGREIYWLPPDGRMSDSKLTGAAFERALGRAATFRNDRTVAAVAAKLT